jgi:uncharacterized protein (TIRG00374 family)
MSTGDSPLRLAAPSGTGCRLALSWLSGLLILAAVVLVATRFTELEHFAVLLRQAQPLWLLLAFGLQCLTYIVAAAVWHGALRHMGSHRRFWSIVPLGLAKLFTDQALPTGGIGGTLLVVMALERRGITSGLAMAALLIGMISFYVAYLSAVLAALAVLYFQDILDLYMIGAAVIFVFVATGIPLIVLALRRWSVHSNGPGKASPMARWLNHVPGVATLLEALAAAPARLLRNPKPFLQASLLQMMVFLLDAATLWVMLQAIGASTAPSAAFAAFMMASLAATIGPMPLGLGTFEAVSVAILHLQGQSVEAALTATLLLRGFTFWLPMLPGLLIARRELRRHGHTTGRHAAS